MGASKVEIDPIILFVQEEKRRHALDCLSLARTALDDPAGLPDDAPSTPDEPALRLYAIDQIDLAMRALGANDERPNWERDEYQFPRLLSEILATIAIDGEDWAALRDSMDLTDDELEELFDRAHAAWERIKAATT